MLPVHWATFDLALHPWAEPVERLLKVAGEERAKICTPKVGEWLKLGKDERFGKWWI